MGTTMKGCLVKQYPYINIVTESLPWAGAEALLEAYVLKSQAFSLLVELEADVWVVEGCTKVPNSHIQVMEPELMEAYRQMHKTVPWAAIPWDRYDVVISMLPIIPGKIIQRHPKILFGYYAYTHNTRLYKDSLDQPFGRYDLFLDHLLWKSGIEGLPQAIGFPYPVNPDIMRALIVPTNETAVFLDSHLIADYKANPKRFRKGCGLPVRHSIIPNRRDKKRHKKFASWQFDKTMPFLQKLGACKYLLLARKGGFVGQGVIEAAALGLIVVSGPGRYASIVCHPQCVTKPGDVDRGLRAIGRIEANPALQKEILAHQDTALRDVFWRKPLEMLRRGLELKRR